MTIDRGFARQILEQALIRRRRYETRPDVQDDDLAGPIEDEVPRAPEGEPARASTPVVGWLDAWIRTAGALEWLTDALGLPPPPAIERRTGNPF